MVVRELKWDKPEPLVQRMDTPLNSRSITYWSSPWCSMQDALYLLPRIDWCFTVSLRPESFRPESSFFILFFSEMILIGATSSAQQNLIPPQFIGKEQTQKGSYDNKKRKKPSTFFQFCSCKWRCDPDILFPPEHDQRHDGGTTPAESLQEDTRGDGHGGSYSSRRSF